MAYINPRGGGRAERAGAEARRYIAVTLLHPVVPGMLVLVLELYPREGGCSSEKQCFVSTC